MRRRGRSRLRAGISRPSPQLVGHAARHPIGKPLARRRQGPVVGREDVPFEKMAADFEPVGDFGPRNARRSGPRLYPGIGPAIQEIRQAQQAVGIGLARRQADRPPAVRRHKGEPVVAAGGGAAFEIEPESQFAQQRNFPRDIGFAPILALQRLQQRQQAAIDGGRRGPLRQGRFGNGAGSTDPGKAQRVVDPLPGPSGLQFGRQGAEIARPVRFAVRPSGCRDFRPAGCARSHAPRCPAGRPAFADAKRRRGQARHAGRAPPSAPARPGCSRRGAGPPARSRRRSIPWQGIWRAAAGNGKPSGANSADRSYDGKK